MILLIDALDSFTYNLVQALQALGAEVVVERFDAIDLDRARTLAPEAIVLSPGPGHPKDCLGHMTLARSEWDVPILGVCLGHQALAHAAGARVTHAKEPLHGERAPALHDGTGLFTGLPPAVGVGRYHSLVVDEATLPSEYRVTARSEHGEVMAMQHARLPRWGVQFHPESILTPDGPALLANFLRLARAR